MLQNLNYWELSLQVWAGGSFYIPIMVTKNNLVIPASVLEKFRFPQEGCQTVR